MRKITVYRLAFIVTLVFCLSVAPSAIAASDEKEVLQVVKDFSKSFNTLDFGLMSSLWLHSEKISAFEPGIPFLFQGWESEEMYWKSTLKEEAGPVSHSLHNPQITMIGDNAAVITGYHYVVETDSETKEQTVSYVRQTLVVQKMKGKWLILHNHASLLPVQ